MEMKITIENYDEKHTFETESEGLTISEMVEHLYWLLHSVGYSADNIRDAFIEKGFQLDEFHFAKERERENVELLEDKRLLEEDRDYYEQALRKSENIVLTYLKDKERLDWLQSSDLTLHNYIERGDVWANKGVWTIREFIDEKIKKDL
jgi:hypothetical protein